MVNKWVLEHLATCPSTNSELMERWRKQKLLRPISLMADEQTSGRGRRGKQWASSSGNSLTFSMAYPFNPQKGMSHLSGLSLFCGLMTLKGIAEYFNIDLSKLHNYGLGLKWPNDILDNEAKLAGILVEGGQNNPNAPIWMIIGIGINLHSPTESIPTDYPITSLKSFLTSNQFFQDFSSVDTVKLWQSLVGTFEEGLQQFNTYGFEYFQSDWNKYHLFNEKAVYVLRDDILILKGKCIGADVNGAIQIQTSTKTEILYSGDISLRLQDV